MRPCPGCAAWQGLSPPAHGMRAHRDLRASALPGRDRLAASRAAGPTGARVRVQGLQPSHHVRHHERSASTPHPHSSERHRP